MIWSFYLRQNLAAAHLNDFGCPLQPDYPTRLFNPIIQPDYSTSFNDANADKTGTKKCRPSSPSNLLQRTEMQSSPRSLKLNFHFVSKKHVADTLGDVPKGGPGILWHGSYVSRQVDLTNSGPLFVKEPLGLRCAPQILALCPLLQPPISSIVDR